MLSRGTRIAPIVAIALATARAVPAQDPAPAAGQPEAALTQTLKAKVGQIPGTIRSTIPVRRLRVPGESLEDTIRFVLRPGDNVDLYVPILASSDAVNLFRSEADEARVDKQIGAGSSSSGSTSLTSKGSAPAILGFAVENGALDRSVSGTSITFTGRPVQIVQALQKTPFGQSFRQIEANASLGALNRLSLAVTFDTSRDNTANTFTASSNQLQSYSVRFDVINDRDPRSSRFDDRWGRLKVEAGAAMAKALYDAYEKTLDTPEFQMRFDPWLADTAAELARVINAGQNDDAVVAAFEKRLAAFPSADGIPGADAALKGFASASAAMLTARSEILSYVGKSPIVTLEYNGTRAEIAKAPQVQLPDTSNLTLIAELAPCGGCSFTLNGSATIFNSAPVNTTASRLRDVVVSSQLDIPVNAAVAQLGNVVLSFAFQYKHLPNDVLAIAVPGQPAAAAETSGIDAALKGDLILGQAKLTIPVKGSGIKIPLSVTFANRTELIKESNVRANLGFTFDFDTIVSKLKP